MGKEDRYIVVKSNTKKNELLSLRSRRRNNFKKKEHHRKQFGQDQNKTDSWLGAKIVNALILYKLYTLILYKRQKNKMHVLMHLHYIF